MKNQIILISLLFITLSVTAQNKWTEYSSNIIKNATTNEDFTWLIYSNKAIKINNVTLYREEIMFPKELFYERECLAYKDELWILTEIGNSEIFHFKDGTWSSFKNSGTEYIIYTGINSNDGTAVFIDPLSDQMIIIKNNNKRVISIPDNIECNSNICIPSSNSIMYYSLKSSMIIELDTNGILKNKFTTSEIGTTSTFSNTMIADKNKNIYTYFENDGIFKITLGLTDTTFQKIIPKSKLNSLDWESFSVDPQNNIIIKSSSYQYDTLYTYFNPNGIEMYSINVPNGNYGSSYKLAGYNHQGNPISIYKNMEVWLYSLSSWELIFNPKSKYEGEMIRFSTQGLNNEMYLGQEKVIYKFQNDYIDKLNFSELYTPNNYRFKSMIMDNFGTLYISLTNNGKLELAKIINNNSKIEFESKVVTSTLYASDLDGNEMLINNENKLLVLIENSIMVYNGSNNWTSITTNPNDNISELYSICKDHIGNIWVGTNKGVAMVVNNQIELQTAINKKNKIKKILYNKNNNCLVFVNSTDFSASVCLYYLNTQNLVTLNSNQNVPKIEVDNNKLYFQKSSNEIWRYNISTKSLDTLFNDNIANTPFNIYPSFIKSNNTDKVFLCVFNYSTINEYMIYVYDENGFSYINDKYNHINTTLYPNPSFGVVNINSLEKFQSFIVYNFLGETLYFGKIENGKIDLSSLPSGIYSIKLSSSNGEVFKKIIKN